MAHAHPKRPYEEEKRVNERSNPPTSAAHPPTPYGTSTGSTNSDSIGHGRMGKKTPLGPMPTRSGNLSRPFGSNET